VALQGGEWGACWSGWRGQRKSSGGARAEGDDSRHAAPPPLFTRPTNRCSKHSPKPQIEMCTREDNHDWARCPFAHEKEKARRRDPRLPDTMQGGSCARGDACAYTHSVQEYWLHPDRFRTQMCKNGAHCTRPLCFFAHRCIVFATVCRRGSAERGRTRASSYTRK